MSSTIRDIITEALSRANIVPRKQNVPAHIAESAFQLLKGIAAKFSNDNLLQFLRREIDFTPHSNVVKIGENVDGNDVDVVAVNLQDVKTVYISDNGFYPLDFVSYEDFYSESYGEYVYSWQSITDKQGNLYLKDRVIELGKPLKVIYNVKWNFDIDSELFVPDQYIELFNVALTHKLALKYPRISQDQVMLIKNELDDMISNVKVQTRANKVILRKPHRDGLNYSKFLRGDFL